MFCYTGGASQPGPQQPMPAPPVNPTAPPGATASPLGTTVPPPGNPATSVGTTVAPTGGGTTAPSGQQGGDGTGLLQYSIHTLGWRIAVLNFPFPVHCTPDCHPLHVHSGPRNFELFYCKPLSNTANNVFSFSRFPPPCLLPCLLPPPVDVLHRVTVSHCNRLVERSCAYRHSK